MALSHPVCVGARYVRCTILALAVMMMIGAVALQAFDLRYGQPATSSLPLRSAGTDLGAALVEQEAVTRWMPRLPG